MRLRFRRRRRSSRRDPREEIDSIAGDRPEASTGGKAGHAPPGTPPGASSSRPPSRPPARPPAGPGASRVHSLCAGPGRVHPVGREPAAGMGTAAGPGAATSAATSDDDAPLGQLAAAPAAAGRDDDDEWLGWGGERSREAGLVVGGGGDGRPQRLLLRRRERIHLAGDLRRERGRVGVAAHAAAARRVPSRHVRRSGGQRPAPSTSGTPPAAASTASTAAVGRSSGILVVSWGPGQVRTIE